MFGWEILLDTYIHDIVLHVLHMPNVDRYALLHKLYFDILVCVTGVSCFTFCCIIMRKVHVMCVSYLSSISKRQSINSRYFYQATWILLPWLRIIRLSWLEPWASVCPAIKDAMLLGIRWLVQMYTSIPRKRS